MQKIIHTYGEHGEQDDIEEEEILAEVQNRLRKQPKKTAPPVEAVNRPSGARVTVGGKVCKCGSLDHQRTSHKSCPLKK